MEFKRPIIRNRVTPMQFVSDGRVSQWVRDDRMYIVPSGTPGLVGDLIDKMNTFNTVHPESRWTPSIYYMTQARHMPPEEAKAHITKCEEWFAENIRPTQKEKKIQDPINHKYILAAFRKYHPSRPPVPALLKAYHLAGCSESYIERSIKWHDKMEETSGARQAALDLIFAKYPATSKPTKVKKAAGKIIKAVKKKM